MSERLPQEPQNEEVDLGQLFNAIGRLFEKLFAFIGNVFKGIFSIIIFALKPLVNNFKLVAIILMIAAAIGFVAEKFSEPVFVSDMLVRPYFDSKYQLANNVNYFNALIGSRNYKEISQIFEIDSSTTAKELIGFKLAIGPETQNDLLKEYDEYIKSIDSTLAADVTYEEFIENRDILSGNVFSIEARAKSNDVFPKLEKGFLKTLENEYSQKLKKIRDSSLILKKATFEKELNRIDSLQKIYIKIKQQESERGEVKVGINGLLPVTQEKTTTREYELFQEEMKIRDNIRQINEVLIEESDYYDILSSFEEVGKKDSSLYNTYTLTFPIMAFFLTIVIYMALKAFKFIKEYE